MLGTKLWYCSEKKYAVFKTVFFYVLDKFKNLQN
jgi:hypothetical protein